MRQILFTIILWHMKPTMTLCEEEVVISQKHLRNGSYFGYSMAFLKNDLVVSAPRADNIGEIYILNTEENSTEKINFNIRRDYTKHNVDYWLGATVSKGSSYFVTCAPRTITLGHTIPTGTCFSFRKEEVLQLMSKNILDTRFNGGIDSFGWSINVDALDKVYIGSPLLNGGFVEIYETSASAPYILLNTTKTYNFGYGIAIGNFLSDDKKEINFAVSTTYGDYGEGKVFIFDRKYNEVHRISNNEVGSMYGATLCTLHLEGKRSSLLVGAPAYTTNHHEYDHGAVYLYVPDYSKNASQAMVLKRIIKGTSSSGYFGFSIANIGDLDGDGKDDVAIGAPYEDEGKGAVYVYSGHGLLTDNQHLKKIQSTKYTSFGFSLTPLTDSKENTIGLAVGAPFDNTVILYKVTPLITTKLYVQIPNLQAREDKTQFNFTACVNITYPRITKTISTEIILRTEIIHPFAKLINAETNGSIADRVELRRRPPNYCKTYQVLTPETGNFGTMIKYNITTVIDDMKSKKSKIDGTKVDFSDISVRHLEGDIWAADCNITYGRCFPKLVVKPSSTLSDPYEVGLYDTERYFMTIKNVGETAYNVCFIVTLKGTHIANYPLHCTRTDAANQVICKLDIWPNDYSWMTGSIEIDTSFVTNKFDELEIQTDIYINCTDRTDKQTIKETFKLMYNVTGINIDGIANPYKDINITTVDVVSGKFFEHLYMIRNGGGMDYENASFEVTLDKKDYLKWMLDEKIWNCSLVDSPETPMDDKIKYTCIIDNLHRYSDVNIHIPVQILPDTFGKYIKNENTITSTLTLKLKEEIKEKRLTTTLVYMSTSVAAWIIILSILIGLIVLVLIALILREIGFFQRKNKKNLEDLKIVVRNESIRRQSQRQSNRDQTEQSDQTKQTEQSENDHCYDNDRKDFDSSEKLC